MPRLTPLLIVALVALLAGRGMAQLPLGAEPAHEWRTIGTAHFRDQLTLSIANRSDAAAR